MVTSHRARTLSLALEHATEQDHHGFPSFRVRGKIFATLPDDGHLHVMLDAQEIRAAVREHPDACSEQWWGQKLAAVRVTLAEVEEGVLQDLLYEAWDRVRP